MASTDEFRLAAAQLHDAESYHDVFHKADKHVITQTFRTLMRKVHPDVVAPKQRSEADAVVARLNQLHADALAALADGSFGRLRPLLTLGSATFQHECMKRRPRFFDMTAGYDAVSTSNSAQVRSIVKIACAPRDNELLAAEADALRRLSNASDDQIMFYPDLIDTFAVADGRKRLRANAIAQLDGFVNLEEVRERYPAGIHPLDMGWVWRRVLWALGGAHELGVLHGALVPSHIMIHPTLHGVVLVDWCYSVLKAGDVYSSLNAIVGAKRDWYPKTVLKRDAPTEALDLGLAAHSMVSVTDETLFPDMMRRYFAKLTSGDSTTSAYELLAQFDALLERLGAPYYPRTYRPLNW